MNVRQENENIVLFDGVCNLCDRSVQFIIRHDPTGRFRFASLQSDAGQTLLREYGIADSPPESIVLVEGDRLFTHSTAALRIARHLRFPWSLAAVFLLVPPPIRNSVYRMIARNRYRWFGKKEACLLPSPDIRARFLS